MSGQYLPCEIVQTQESVQASVIWLHGLGANGHDFVPIVPELRLPASCGVRFIFPHAPEIPVTINGGYVMPAWYDILEMSLERKIDQHQILQSAQAVIDLVEREVANGIPSEKIVLAGFSQGGAVVYQAALSYNKSLAGLMTLSTYFATSKTIELSQQNRGLPIHLFHGEYDDVVPEQMGRQAFNDLEELGYKPEYKSYPVDHAVHPQEIADISSWLQRVLA